MLSITPIESLSRRFLVDATRVHGVYTGISLGGPLKIAAAVALAGFGGFVAYRLLRR